MFNEGISKSYYNIRISRNAIVPWVLNEVDERKRIEREHSGGNEKIGKRL